MTSPDRSAINYGPGKATFSTLDLFSEGDMTADIKEEFFEVKTSAFGTISNRRKNLQVDVSLTPKMLDAATIAGVLLPYAAVQIGASIYGASDSPLVIIPRTGATGITVANAQITKLPSLKLTADASVMGAMTFTGIIANASDPSALTSWYAISDTHAALTGFDKTKVPGGLYQATYGTITTPFFAEDGFAIDFALQLKDQMVEGLTYDKTLESLTATCKCAPVGPALSALTALMSSSTPHGGEPPAADLVITGPINFTLKNCQIRQAQGRYGSSVKRVGEIEFVTQRTATNGLLDALWTVSDPA